MSKKKTSTIIAAACLLAATGGMALAATDPWIKAKPVLEAALACNRIDNHFTLAEQALQGAAWNSSQGVQPVALPVTLKVYGLATQRVAVFRDGGEQLYRSYLPGVSIAQAVKAAQLKLGKDGQEYGRVTKMGVLTAGTEDGVTTLTCTFDSEA